MDERKSGGAWSLAGGRAAEEAVDPQSKGRGPGSDVGGDARGLQACSTGTGSDCSCGSKLGDHVEMQKEGEEGPEKDSKGVSAVEGRTGLVYTL